MGLIFMKRMVKKPLKDIKVNDILAEDAVNAQGILLACRGTVITPFILTRLQSQMRDSYCILSEEETEDVWEEKYEELVDKTEEKEKLVFSEQLKERVAQGVEYIYSNLNSEEAVSESANISEELLDTINHTTAIRMSLMDLKVSDEYTFKHSVDVATMALMIGKRLNFEEKELHLLGMAGILHDVGKIKISNDILNKPDKLTDEEFDAIKMHTVYGYEVLADKKLSESVKKAVLQHHERMDGTGYPSGLSGEEIGIFGRILTVADVFDALVTERPYHEAYTPATAVEMLMAKTMHFDMKVLKAFLDTVILYPVGTIVNLSNGECAKVLKNISSYPQRPVVVGMDSGKVYDLFHDFQYANIVIL